MSTGTRLPQLGAYCDALSTEMRHLHSGPHHHHHTTTTTTTTTHTNRRLGSQVLRASVIFVDTLAGDLSMAARAPPLFSSGGSAVRRRERRLRSFWRHEQMAIQMALASVTHHSFQVGTAHDALRRQKPVTSAGGMRPLPFVEGQPQVRIHRHTVEQRIEHTPFVQILDAPVPKKVEQLVDFFKDLDSHVPLQVIEVPKISQDIIPQRSVDLVPQMAEQLVEVPTLLSVAVLQQRTAEQLASIPAPRGRHGRLPGSLPGQGSTASAAEQIADIPSSSGDLQGFRPRQRVQQRFQSRTFPLQLHVVEVFVVVFTFFLRFKGPQWIFQFLLGTLMKGFFALFPRVKKSAKVGAHSRSAQAAHSSSSTPGAYGVVSSLEQPVQSQQVDQGSAVVEDRAEWRVIEDSETGQPYYYNLWTLEIRWTLPPGASSSSRKKKKKKRKEEEEDETHDYEVPIPLLFLMAGSACWLRILLCGEGLRSLPLPGTVLVCFCRCCSPSAPCSVVFSSSTLAVVCPRLVLLIFISRSVPFFCRLAHDARHHGRYGPEGLLHVLVAVACARLVLLAFTPRAVFPWLAGPDAQLLGQYEPEGFCVLHCCSHARCVQ